MRQSPLSVFLITIVAFITTANAEPIPTTAPATGLSKMPVKEVTIFKDGHALLLHAGKMPTDSAGNVLLDNLPAPVLGTFWPYSNDPAVKLSAVVAGERRIIVNHTTLAIPDLLRANIGAHVVVKTDTDYEGTIVDLPSRGIDELRATDPTTVARLPQDGEVLLLKTGAGTKVLNITAIQSLIFEGDYKTTASREETRTLLTLKLQWPGNQPKPQADVGMMYLQKGIRWIPSYKISVDGNGHADVQMQATILNELTDLDDVTANLVIGVPSFAFKDTTDPIAIQQVVAQLSPYFQNNANTAYGMSNAIMTQARMGERQMGGGFGGGGGGAAPLDSQIDLGPEVAGSQKNEDLFVFTVKHITLKKGERMVIPVTQFTLAYTDVYKLDIPITPPEEIFRSLDGARQAELAQLFHSPKVMHTLRLTNTADMPITTAPALLLRDGKVLAQSMTEYTPQKASLDLPVTATVDVLVTKSEKETKRTPNAVNWEGSEYARIDLEGSLKLTNHRSSPVTLEISRSILGEVDSADNDGKTEMLNVFEDQSFLPSATQDNQPNGWGGYNWPYWWNHFNGIGRVTWKATLDPGKDLEVKYAWHYFWR
jgi:hypothetical protein